ncbi:acyltransferase family protein [Lichenihabitans psoromatis]|uniref:acyltransferase family protein n=1 Tax=Lichenihabitans psoromatis TaxID=2528642 RepID=UPI001035E29B|nr:acyltransferase family protein [Lichenihabitans psoromatis]
MHVKPAPGAARFAPNTSPRPYRADIDGLRAIAVIGVILFHFGFWPPGGYTGVDLFFVISGFLIASILDTETTRGTFSMVSFYERRARRILPAFLLVLIVSALASTTLLPNDLKSIGLGFINAATFTSNIYFSTLANDYFAAGGLAVQPTLHTWSLALEAQFYIVFPWLWLAGLRHPGWRRTGFVILAGLSFAASLWGVAHRPESTFYLLPTRLWEFLAGSALVLIPAMSRLGPVVRAAQAWLGLGLIAAGFLLLSPATPFPGAAALPSCLGAALLIAAGNGPHQPSVNRRLGAAPLAFVGRLSYALYLWHWPVLMLAGYGRTTPLPFAERLGLIALTVLLSLLSWWLVERPIIARRWLAGRRSLLAACLAGVIGAAALGLVLNLVGQDKLTLTRLPAPVLTLANGQFDTVKGECRPSDMHADVCRWGRPGVEPTVAVWGNSFARMWVPALGLAADPHRVAGISLLLSRCPPLLGVSVPDSPGCAAFNKEALAFIEAHPALKTVLIGGNWTSFTHDLPALGDTIAALTQRGRRVVVILPSPAALYDVPRSLALAALHHEPPPPLQSEAAARAALAGTTAILSDLHKTQTFETIDPFTALCDGATCAVAREGHALYADQDHVTRFGSTLFPSLFDPLFAP